MFALASSAVLVLLLGERGSDVVGPLTDQSEVLTKTAESGGDLAVTEAILTSWGVRIRASRDGHAIETARLRPLTKHLGLSLGDRACLAQGRMSMMPILTSDTRMAQADVGLDIRMIR